MSHRGALAADGRTSDGAGILLPLVPALQPVEGCGIGTVFVRTPDDREVLTEACRREGLEVVAWREVPVDRSVLGRTALDSLPKLAPSGCADCFEYTIDYAGVRYAADESNLPDRLRPVITSLNDLIAAHGKDAGASVLGGK